MALDDAVAEADLDDPNPDVGDLFHHYDDLYFRGALAAAGFTVEWRSSSSSAASRSFGSCIFSRQQNTITLSESFLKYRSCTDRKNALLHEMIHAIIYVKRQRKDRNHGPDFRAWMDAINSCCVQDHQRPDGGYNITTRHDFIPEGPHSLKGIVWKCRSCGDTLLRATNQGPPSDVCCIENDDISGSCGNMLCYWHNHKNDCSGTYEKMPSQKKVAGGAQLLLTLPSDMSKSKGAIQESSSSVLQLEWGTKATKPIVEDKHLCRRSGSSSKKGDKRRSLEKVGETSEPANPQKRLKQEPVAQEKKELSPLLGCSNEKLLDWSSSKKAYKQQEPKDNQKTIVLPSAPGIKTMTSVFVASEKQRKEKCKRNPAKEKKKVAKEKEYVAAIPWLNYYESDRSSGSTEPLVNKRTERRRRERAKYLTHSQSKKKPSVNSPYASVSSHKIEMAAQNESMQQPWPPSPSSDHAVVTTANQVVVTPATGDQSQPSAPCLDVVPFLHPADPSTSPDQSTALDIIVISDDDI